MKLLATRPLPGADATVARIEAAGHQAIRMPLFAVHPIAWYVPDPKDFDALLLTSSNAVRLARAGLQQLSSLPVYAVGQVTAQTANIGGMHIAEVGKGGAQDMLPLAERAGHRRLLWLAGQDRISISPPVGMSVEPVTVYASDPVPVPADFSQRLMEADAVLLHSARAAAHFAGLCDAAGCARDQIWLGAFSPAIAEAAGTGWRGISVADAPNDAALLAALAIAFT